MTSFDIRLPDPRVQIGAPPIAIVSADAHVGLPARDYIPYLDPQYREHAEPWLADVATHHEVAGRCGYPFPQEELEIIDTRRAIRNGGEIGNFDPDRRLREAEADGVVAEFLHPFGNIGSTPFYDVFNSVYSPELRTAGAIAHNRFLVDFCATAPERLLGVHLTYPWPDFEAAADQCRIAREAGARAVVPAQQAGIPGDPCPGFYDPAWDPFWAACQEYDLVVQVHAGWGKPQGMLAGNLKRAFERAEKARESAVSDNKELSSALSEAFDTFAERKALWQLMVGGVFDRFPRLKITFAEIHADWVPGTLAYLDSLSDEFGDLMKERPSDYWVRHCAVGASLMRLTDVDARDAVGKDKIMFGTDYPHMEGSWPNTRDWLRATVSQIPEADARALLGGNAIEWYGLDRDLLERTAMRVGPFPADILGDQTVDPAMLAHFHKRGGIGKREVSLFHDQLVEAVGEDTANARSARGINVG